MSKKKFWALVLPLIITACLLLFSGCRILTALVLLNNSDKLLKNEWDNEYINSEYENWQAVNITAFGKIFFPGEWNITEKDCVFNITLNSKQIAHGVLLRVEDAIYETQYDYLGSVLSFAPIDRKMVQPDVGFWLDSASFHVYEYTDGSNCEEFAVLQFEASKGAKLFLFFPSVNQKNPYINQAIAQAIIYSYFYVAE